MEKLTNTIALPISSKEVTIKEGDGYSDKILLKKNKKLYETYPEYLASLIVEIDGKERVSKKDVLDLFAPDQEYLAIECYKLNYGNDFRFMFTCPTCEHPEEHSIDLEKLEFKDLPDELKSTDPIVEGTLPRSRRRVTVGMLNGHQEALLLEQIISGPVVDSNQSAFQAIRFLDGSRDFSYEDVINFVQADLREIRRLRRKLLCGYDTEVVVKCSECGEKSSINLMTSRDFLLPEG